MAEGGGLVQQLVDAGEQGKRDWKLGHWKGTTQTGDAQNAQHCASGLVEAEAEAGIGSAKLTFARPWPYVDNPVQAQVQEER